jgi:guanine deaminase
MQRRKQIFVGRIVHSKSLQDLEIYPRAVLGVSEHGIIKFLDNTIFSAEEAYQKYPDFNDAICTKLKPLEFLFPGLIDTHLHAPQWPNLAIGMEGHLQEWCDNYTDPIEESYKDNEKVMRVYSEMVQKELELGTTTCVYNSTIHFKATNILADMCQKYG